MKSILLRPAAAADIEEAFAWYERHRAGLGREFLDAIQSAIETIRKSPDTYPIVHRDTRRLLIRRFPYAIFYRTYSDHVLVVACIHASRDPKQWKVRR